MYEVRKEEEKEKYIRGKSVVRQEGIFIEKHLKEYGEMSGNNYICTGCSLIIVFFP